MNVGTPKIIFCRRCMDETLHLKSDHIHEKPINEFSKRVYQIVYCKQCKEAILEIFDQYFDEDETTFNAERHPDFRKGFKKPIENIKGAIELEIFIPYSDCIKCYNQQLYRASFLYLVITINLISGFLLTNHCGHNIIGKSLIYKANLLRRKGKKNNMIKMFSSIFSKTMADYKKCLDPNFTPIISDLDEGIDALHGFLQRIFVLQKMNDSVDEDLINIYYKQSDPEKSI